MLEDNPILQSVSSWFRRNFSDPEALSLFMTLVLGLLVIEFFGKILLPILISIVIAYLLAGLVRLLERWHVPHMLSVILVYLFFVGIVAVFLVVLIPLFAKQFTNLLYELPDGISKSQIWFNELITKHPKLLGSIKFNHVIDYLQSQGTHIAQTVLKYSLATIPSVISIILYFVLVPILVYFFLKDSKPIANWLSRFLPNHRTLMNKVWTEVNEKIGAYIRGRVLEMLIVFVITTIAFVIIGLQYAVLLGFLVGLSVLIPYVGAVVVTVPVVAVGLIQWGFDIRFWILVIVYAVIITIDGNLLAPKLLAKFMDLHPIVIIISVVFFGAIWGFWGVFFAVPLAMLINVVLQNWPRQLSEP